MNLEMKKNLSPRQSKILQLISEGKRDKEIANDLDLKVSTVKMHVGRLMAKLGAQSRAHAVYLQKYIS